MGIKEAPTKTGKEAARDFRRETAEEERQVEKAKGGRLKKGAERVDERSRSSDGKGVGQTQKE